MKNPQSKWVFLVIGLSIISLILAVITILTTVKLRSEKPVAPTAPESQPQAIEGSPVPACQKTFSLVSPTPTPIPTATPIPTPNPSPSPTPTPSPISAICVNISIYKVSGDDPTLSDNWVLIPDNELPFLKPADVIYITTIGSVSNGIIDKARFRMNDSVWIETVNKKPSSQEFYVRYVIPPDVYTFTFGAEIHEQIENKWY